MPHYRDLTFELFYVVLRMESLDFVRVLVHDGEALEPEEGKQSLAMFVPLEASSNHGREILSSHREDNPMIDTTGERSVSYLL